MDATNYALVIAAANREDAERKSYELREVKSELARHHADFQKISDLLDEFFKSEPDPIRAIQTLKQIRNIVG